MKSSLQSPLRIRFFIPPSFCVQTTLQSTSKIFSLPQPLSQSCCIKRSTSKGILWGLMLVISLFFLKVQTETIQLTITDSLSLVVSDEDVCNQKEKPSNTLPPLPSTYCRNNSCDNSLPWDFFFLIILQCFFCCRFYLLSCVFASLTFVSHSFQSFVRLTT